MWVKQFSEAQTAIRQLEHTVRVLRGALEYLVDVMNEEQLAALGQQFNERVFSQPDM